MQGICDGLAIQSSIDGYPWRDLCIQGSQGNFVRVLSPNSYIQLQPNAFSDYWTYHVDKVWSRYSVETLVINTQSSELGNISCIVEGDLLICLNNIGTDHKGDIISASLTRPSSKDIFSYSTGPFTVSPSTSDLLKSIIPRRCAAFNRSTPLADNENMQPNGPRSLSYPPAQQNPPIGGEDFRTVGSVNSSLSCSRSKLGCATGQTYPAGLGLGSGSDWVLGYTP